MHAEPRALPHAVNYCAVVRISHSFAVKCVALVGTDLLTASTDTTNVHERERENPKARERKRERVRESGARHLRARSVYLSSSRQSRLGFDTLGMYIHPALLPAVCPYGATGTGVFAARKRIGGDGSMCNSIVEPELNK